MKVIIDDVGATLSDVGEFARFHVESRVDASRADAHLRANGMGHLIDGEHAAIKQAYVIAQAAASLPPGTGWRNNFDKMVDYAASKSWITAKGDIIAHVDWKNLSE